MDFWRAYEKKEGEEGFGGQLLWLNTGARPNASLARCRERSVELDPGKALFHQWNPKARYLIAKSIVFDLFVSFYDLNSKGIVAIRLTEPLIGRERAKVKKFVRSMRKAHFEMRAIGLQNNYSELVHSIKLLRKAARCELVEVDLFGDRTRHLAIDLLTGKPYSLLLENRIYRPGELVSTLKNEEFVKTKGKLSFV